MGDWSATTPNGNEINNFTDHTLYLKNETQLNRLDTWYFYKDCILGELKDNLGYFVVNEYTFKVDTFKTESDFQAFVTKNNLEPKIWKRYYKGNWIFFGDELLFCLFLGFYISIPLMLFYLFMLYKSIVIERFNFKKPYTLISFLILILIIICWLLERFPQSI